MTRLKNFDWEAIAGVIAATLALLLHLLHVADQGVLLAVALVILALILLRDLRREDRDEKSLAAVESNQQALREIRTLLKIPDTLLIGPRSLRSESERFAHGARGEMVWFNVCLLMFIPQSLFDALLLPALTNPRVTSIQFILDPKEQKSWQEQVLPKVTASGSGAKLLEPIWIVLDEAASFILTENAEGLQEAHLSFWGEPFMSHTPGGNLPRYVFHVQPHSELIARLAEMSRQYQISGRPRA